MARHALCRLSFSSLPQTEGGFDAVVAGLVLDFPFFAARWPGRDGSSRSTRRRGSGLRVGLHGGMQMMRVFWDTATALDPAARELDEGVQFPLSASAPAAGLRTVWPA